ncbi:MAG: hypothetical protein A4S09_00180 [Proteobacteria bacterium SG_bin7]|nr:MAG: hypothetical protein A4S09_00180 [Proteobacteria bacterium SG_bin7]
MKRSFGLCLVAVGILTACGGGSSGSGIPGALDSGTKSEILKVRVLSEGHRANASAIFKASAIKMPASTVMLNDKSSTSRYDRALRKLDDIGRKNLATIQQKCKISLNTPNPGDLELGKTLVTTKKGLVSGADCPVNFESNFKVLETVTSVDRNNRLYSKNSSLEELNKFKISDEKMKQESMSSGYELKVSARSAFENTSEDLSKGRIYVIVEAQGSHDLLNGQRIPMRAKIELLRNLGKSKAQCLIIASFPGAEVAFGFTYENGEFKYYFNGEQTTKERLAEEFAIDFDDLMVDGIDKLL